jgi:hypothetical protein
MEEWAHSMFCFSTDGYGGPWRIMQQLLTGSMMVRVDSPYKDAFMERFTRGKHYLPVATDMTDYLQVTLGAIAAAKKDMETFRRGAEEAADIAAEEFSLPHVLDTLMWVVLKIKQHSPWKVRPPHEDSLEKWVQLEKSEEQWNIGGVPEDVRAKIRDFHRQQGGIAREAAAEAGAKGGAAGEAAGDDGGVAEPSQAGILDDGVKQDGHKHHSRPKHQRPLLM